MSKKNSVLKKVVFILVALNCLMSIVALLSCVKAEPNDPIYYFLYASAWPSILYVIFLAKKSAFERDLRAIFILLFFSLIGFLASACLPGFAKWKNCKSAMKSKSPISAINHGKEDADVPK